MNLIAIPYHENKRYSLNHIMGWVNKADLPDCEVIMRWHRGTFGEHDAVKKQREFFRRLAIDINAEHLMFVGADTIPPLDVLPRLLAHNKDVVGGLYYMRPNGNPNTTNPIAYRDNDDKSFLSPGLHQVDAMGMDCVLLSRKALKDISWTDYEVSNDDIPIYQKLKSLGYGIWLDSTIVCKHYQTEKDYK